MTEGPPGLMIPIDYRRAFEDAPVGQLIARNRIVCDCNRALAKMFRTTVEGLVGCSTKRLFPSQARFEETGRRIAPLLAKNLTFADDRVMCRSDGELFWAHVSGYTYTPDEPYRETIWAFTDLSENREVSSKLRGAMTPRERDIAVLFIEGKSAKEAAQVLGISHRTVDIYRGRLLGKYGVSSTKELVKRLLAG